MAKKPSMCFGLSCLLFGVVEKEGYLILCCADLPTWLSSYSGDGEHEERKIRKKRKKKRCNCKNSKCLKLYSVHLTCLAARCFDTLFCSSLLVMVVTATANALPRVFSAKIATALDAAMCPRKRKPS